MQIKILWYRVLLSIVLRNIEMSLTSESLNFSHRTRLTLTCGLFQILLCDSCDSGYHTACLRPPLMIIPDGEWFCPPCQHVRSRTPLFLVFQFYIPINNTFWRPLNIFHFQSSGYILFPFCLKFCETWDYWKKLPFINNF